jgi:hypothetical protein
VCKTYHSAPAWCVNIAGWRGLRVHMNSSHVKRVPYLRTGCWHLCVAVRSCPGLRQSCKESWCTCHPVTAVVLQLPWCCCCRAAAAAATLRVDCFGRFHKLVEMLNYSRQLVEIQNGSRQFSRKSKSHMTVQTTSWQMTTFGSQKADIRLWLYFGSNS